LSCPLTQSFAFDLVLWQAPYLEIYQEWGTQI
jgi:hypothetical protein